MADKRHGEIVTSLHKWGWPFTRSDPTQRQVEEPGRPDILAVSSTGRGVQVEVKTGDTGFDYAAWHRTRPKQVLWWSNWAAEGHLWVALSMGTGRTNSQDPRRMYLMPFWIFLHGETMVSPFQSTLPYRAGKGYSLELQERGIDAERLFAGHELTWQGTKDKWGLPQEHPFYQIYHRIGTDPAKAWRETYHEWIGNCPTDYCLNPITEQSVTNFRQRYLERAG